MSEKILKIKGWKCLRCGHQWFNRSKFADSKADILIPINRTYPTICPKCKNLNWNKKKKIS